jgi:cytochrome c-type biogenesis protein CcmH
MRGTGRLRLAAASILLTFALGPAAGWAVQPDEVLQDPALERRAREISTELRCLVCQNQSIDDSDAPLARDLRLLVRERLRAGDTDRQVRDFLVQRYGEFVLLKPVLAPHTLVLWLTPIAVLLAGAIGLYRWARRRPSRRDALSPEEQARLDALLDRNG